jgi:hypothetical protein
MDEADLVADPLDLEHPQGVAQVAEADHVPGAPLSQAPPGLSGEAEAVGVDLDVVLLVAAEAVVAEVNPPLAQYGFGEGLEVLADHRAGAELGIGLHARVGIERLGRLDRRSVADEEAELHEGRAQVGAELARVGVGPGVEQAEDLARLGREAELVEEVLLA